MFNLDTLKMIIKAKFKTTPQLASDGKEALDMYIDKI